jgi:hypothetical protein
MNECGTRKRERFREWCEGARGWRDGRSFRSSGGGLKDCRDVISWLLFSDTGGRTSSSRSCTSLIMGRRSGTGSTHRIAICNRFTISPSTVLYRSSSASNTSVVQSSRIMDCTHRGRSMPSSFNADCVGAFPVKSSSSSCNKSKTHRQHPKTLTHKLQTLAANPSLHFHCRLSQNVIPTTPKLYTSDFWVALRSSVTSGAR